MKPSPFGYSRPGSTAEALATLAAFGPDAKVLAGGQSLVPLMSMRLAAPSHLVDINRLTELSYVRVDDGQVRVGALARHTDVLLDQAAAAAQPLLATALRFVAHPAIRNRGTTVGSLVHADPAGEMTAVLALLEGAVRVASQHGERVVLASEFFLGTLESDVRPGELAVEALFPVRAPRSGTAFVEVSRRRGDYAICGVAGEVRLGEDGEVRSARAAYLSVGPRPLVLDLPGDFAAAADIARERVGPETDIHATADYRRHLAGVLTERALLEARAEARKHADQRDGGGRTGSKPAKPRPAHPNAGPANPSSAKPHQDFAKSPNTGPPDPNPANGGGESGGPSREPAHDVRLVVNGTLRNVRVPARRLLSDCLRHDLRLTGTHVGCEHGVCGACTVLVNETAARSCLMLAVTADGAEITTVEGLAEPDGALSPVQQAFTECHGLQCGFCTPGFLMTISAGLRDNPNPSEAQAREMAGGNLCRCTGYANIVGSVMRAAELRREQGTRAERAGTAQPEPELAAEGKVRRQ